MFDGRALLLLLILLGFLLWRVAVITRDHVHDDICWARHTLPDPAADTTGPVVVRCGACGLTLGEFTYARDAVIEDELHHMLAHRTEKAS